MRANKLAIETPGLIYTAFYEYLVEPLFYAVLFTAIIQLIFKAMDLSASKKLLRILILGVAAIQFLLAIIYVSAGWPNSSEVPYWFHHPTLLLVCYSLPFLLFLPRIGNSLVAMLLASLLVNYIVLSKSAIRFLTSLHRDCNLTFPSRPLQNMIIGIVIASLVLSLGLLVSRINKNLPDN